MSKMKLPNRAIGPFPAMIVGTMKEGKPTYTTVGAGGCACLEPVLCVSLKDSHFITEGIAQSGFFSVNIPSRELVAELDYCGIASGWQVDKSELFSSYYDEAGTAPMVAECMLCFVCKVCDAKPIKGFTMFFGEIVAVYADEECLVDGAVDPLKADPIIMMGMSYCGLDAVIGKPFETWKTRYQNEQV